MKAGPVSISSYDIDHGRASGFGGWANAYSGFITPNGDGTAQFSGGSGTLNDGILPTGASTSQLYTAYDHSVTTLHLTGGLFTITKIDLFGFNENRIPGAIGHVKITINGFSDTIVASNFGPLNTYTNVGINQEVDLSSSILSTLATNQIKIEVLDSSYSNYYQIGEVTVDGNPSVSSAVPEPASVITLAAGAIGMLGFRMRKRRLDAGLVA